MVTKINEDMFTPDVIADPYAYHGRLREEAPVKSIQRIASEDVEMYGQRLRTHDRIRWFISSANRDPKTFAQPDTFDISRYPNPHVAFGSGIHPSWRMRRRASACFRSLSLGTACSCPWSQSGTGLVLEAPVSGCIPGDVWWHRAAAPMLYAYGLFRLDPGPGRGTPRGCARWPGRSERSRVGGLTWGRATEDWEVANGA